MPAAPYLPSGADSQNRRHKVVTDAVFKVPPPTPQPRVPSESQSVSEFGCHGPSGESVGSQGAGPSSAPTAREQCEYSVSDSGGVCQMAEDAFIIH